MDSSRWMELENVFEKALELPPQQRASYLEEVCGTSQTFLRQLKSLLEAHEAAPAFLDDLGSELLPFHKKQEDVVAKEPLSDVHHLTGRSIAHYEVLELVGGGGMGVVYKARDTRLNREVALKFLPPEWSSDPGAKTRLLNEARAASVLDHTNIGTVYEVGETPDGLLYIGMAYYDAPTLADRIRQDGPFPIEEAIDFAIQIGQGLIKAHERGIIHRDIKPSNVLVTSDDIVKIVDFGLAKVTSVNITKSNVTLGTTAYMSPEQIRGGRVDHRTDIWSLGVVLYEMLAGRRAFPGNDGMAVLYSVVHNDPEPLRRIRPEIPAELERIVGRAMAKYADARYQSVDEFIDDLQGFMIGDSLKRSTVAGSGSIFTEPSTPSGSHLLDFSAPATFDGETVAVNDRPIRVLVVDDEPDLELLIRQRFRKQIRSREMEFLFAGDGVEALDRLQNEEGVDVVLTDINMPRMDGLTLLLHLGKLDRLLKVIIVSAYGDMENIRAAMNRGAFDFITKPINFEDLEITIRKTHRELGLLREAHALQRRLSALQREIEIASQIQLSSLPTRFPAFPDRSEFDIYATMIPAQEVGGDFYDFFLIDEHRLGFVLGDVSGKGIGAAIFMAITRTMLRATALRGVTADECVTHVNRVLYPETMPQMFVTLVYGIMDTRTGEVSYCNAGHHTPYVMKPSGEVIQLTRTGGLGLCLKPDFVYTAERVVLEPGDRLFLYSDGVTEAVNQWHDRYSDDRLLESLKEVGYVTPAETIREVYRSITRFSDGVVQNDDITMLALKYQGNG